MSLLLAGIKAFVAGATGEVGKGAALALANAGAEVWIAGRSEEKLNALKASFPTGRTVHVVTADYSTVEGAKELEQKVKEFPPFDIVVASSGPWWPIYKLSEVEDIGTLERAFQANVLAQLLLYRVLVKRTKTHFISVNGSAAISLPQSGLTGILANSVVGFAKVAFAECDADNRLPQFTHALVSSSVGHSQFRADTLDPVDFGRVFVAMALGKHKVDSTGSILVNDSTYADLVKQL